MKRCSKCKKAKPFEAFNNDVRNQKDGKRASCRNCERVRVRDVRNQDYWKEHDPYTKNRIHWLGVKRCRLCGRRKPLTLFHRARRNKDGLHAFCMSCVHTYRQQQIYGMSIRDTDTCQACGAMGISVLCIDHDHATGRIRGILCHRCNMVLGAIADDTKILVAMVRYLRKSLIARV